MCDKSQARQVDTTWKNTEGEIMKMLTSVAIILQLNNQEAKEAITTD